jgi:tight adherence protein B
VPVSAARPVTSSAGPPRSWPPEQRPSTRSRPCEHGAARQGWTRSWPLQRRAGGDLARLLRDSARALEDQARLEGEVRAATAQARFTAVIVVLLPLGGALLAELASPGWFAGLWSAFLTAWLVGIALVLQGLAAVLMHRLGQVRC